MRTVIDVDDELLEAAQRELGTTTKKDTVNAALKLVADRRARLQALFEGRDLASTIGVGEDIIDPEVMRAARR